MPKVSVDNLGAVGVVTDIDPQETPPNSFTQLTNFRTSPGGVKTVYSHSLALDYVAEDESLGIAYVEFAGVPFWVSMSNDRVRASNTSTSAQIINSGISAVNLATKWNSAYLAGYLIINNGQQAPWSWDGTLSAGSAVTLANWPASTTARVFRSFKEYLLALDVTESGTRYRTMVRWSHPADPNTLPETWDHTDEEKDAGRVELSSTPHPVTDALALGDMLLVYKQDSVWGFTFIGAPFVFRISKVADDFGCATPGGVVNYPGGHCVLTCDDVVVHNGNGESRSILTYRLREELFTALTPSKIDFAFLVLQKEYNEVWICYPDGQTGSAETLSSCNRAICWNWETNALHKRTLPNVHYGANGAVLTSLVQAQQCTSLVMVTHEETDDFLWMDKYDANVDIPAGVIERQDLALVGRRGDGSPKIDTGVRKVITEFYPRFSLGGTPTITCKFGGRNNLSAANAYTVTRAYTLSRLRMNFVLNRTLFAYRIDVTYASGEDETVQFMSFEFEVKTNGVT